MSTLCPLPGRLPERLGARIQREALAPFPFPRLRAGPWGLNRVPLDFRELTEFGWAREEKLELGEEGGIIGGPGLEPAARELTGAQQQRARGLRGLTACPDYYTFALSLRWGALAAETWAAVSSAALPAPCRIEQIQILPMDSTIASFSLARFLLVDEELAGTFARVNGEDLIQWSTESELGQGTAAWQGRTGFPLPGDTAAESDTALLLHVGRTIEEPGKRVAFAVLNPSAVGVLAVRVTAFVTVQLCAAVSAAPPVSASRISAPRAVVPRPTIAPPPPAAPAPRVHTSSGAYPIMAGTDASGRMIQRWALPDQPGRSFATLAEAQVAYAANQVSALPVRERAAAAAEVRRAAGQLIYGVGELRTPVVSLLAPPRIGGVAHGTPFPAGRIG